MGLTTDDELKAQMMVEAEAAIDAVLAKRKPAEAITLSAIEALALRAGADWGHRVLKAGRRCIPRGRSGSG